jgi:hypothetical protein
MKEWEKKHTSLWKRTVKEQKDLKNVKVKFESVMTQKLRKAEGKRLAAS